MFKNKKRRPNSFLDAVEVQQAVNYDSVLDYLCELKEEEYEKLLKVSSVYRVADKKASDIMGAIDSQTQEEVAQDEDDELDEALRQADTDLGNFADELPNSKPQKSKKVAARD